MKILSISPVYAVIMPDSPLPENAAEAESLVRTALEVGGLEPWAGMSIDLFVCGNSALIIARPSAELKISISPAAIAFIESYFSA